MSEARTVLFRLSNLGEPINNENIANGVLILPVVELPSNYKPGDALFQLRFQLNAASKVSRNGLYTLMCPQSVNKILIETLITNIQLNRRFMKILQLLFQFINQVVITIILNMMMKKIIKTTENITLMS